MNSHFIELCSDCGKTIKQCRCPAYGKKIYYSLCKKCKAHAQEVERHEVRVMEDVEAELAEAKTAIARLHKLVTDQETEIVRLQMGQGV